MPPVDDVALVQSAAAQQSATMARLTEILQSAALTLWGFFGGYYADEDDIPEDFIESLVPMVLGSQAAVSSATDGYLAYLMGDTVTGTQVTGMAARGGTPLEFVYRRPFRKVRYLVDEGMALGEALPIGADRLSSMIATDLQASQFRTFETAARSKRGVVGYRRVLNNPSCALCTVASTQRYKTGQLQPIHENCDCTVAPITGTRDPGRVVNKQLLDTLKGRDSGGRPLYGLGGGSRIVVENHPELGPLISKVVAATTS